MIIERALHRQFLSNTYLVADGRGGPAFFVDAGGPVEPLIAKAEELELKPTHVLLTHHHFDHVSEVGALRKRWPKLEVRIHPTEGELLEEGVKWNAVEPGETLHFGTLEVRPLLTPGHTAGMLSFVVGRAGGPDAGRRRARHRAGSRVGKGWCSRATRSSGARSAGCARRVTRRTRT